MTNRATGGAEGCLPDATERERAATTFDRNVVVTAGAGTGKTTLLVDRLVHLLMRDPDPVAITQMVALTFTNKAANEMRLRLRERLQSYLSFRLDQAPATRLEAKSDAELHSLIQRYRLSKEEIDRRAREALRQFERSYITTIHSFAAWLLRLYPLEAGVDPQFKEDDGSQFKKHFEERWSVWLDQELGREATRQQLWKRVLGKLSLDNLREVASSLCSEMIPLERLSGISNGQQTETILTDWLSNRECEAHALIKCHPDNLNQIDCFARHTLRILQTVLERGEIAAGEFAEEKRWFAEKTLRRAGQWSEDDYTKLERLCRLARGLMRVNRDLTQSLWDLLVPFAEECRESFITRGFVSFDALLVRARNLLRDHQHLREELKHSFKAVLIDEFQDTDPIQYEILLYLAEKPGKSAAEWRSVELQAGKIFVVGDPKQSIYAFRRADIQGYLDVVQHIILAQGGIECPLTANFRSHSGILDVVNGIFEPLIREREGLQPDYVPIRLPNIEENDLGPAAQASFRKVGLCRIESPEELKANGARRLEADNLARWLDEEVLGKSQIRDPEGKWVAVGPKHVALLFRKLTEVHLYLEPLRRRDIPYVVEGEKHFYATQEIVDGVNLLRAVSNPYDQAALVGLLRSPIGGLSDPEIYDLHRKHLLDYRVVRGASRAAERPLERVRTLYEALNRLYFETRTLSVADAVNRIFETIPIRILAARSFSGEQAVANLEKIRQQASIMGRAGLGTLKDVVGQLERRVLEVEEEGESALAEETVDAVKILSIHKAKGLEFPVVVLPDAGGATNPGRFEAGVQYDWSSNLIGLRAQDHLNLAAIYLDEKRRIREEEEQKRVFYVAMTRAREHLMISCPALRADKGSFVEMLQRSSGELSAGARRARVSVGRGVIEVDTLSEPQEAPWRSGQAQSKRPAQTDWSEFVRQWDERSQRYEVARSKPHFVSPTALKERAVEATERFEQRLLLARATDALKIGSLAHGFLAMLDFSADQEKLKQDLSCYMEQQPANIVGSDPGATLRDLCEIFSIFLGSSVFAELRSANILGREIPLLMPWDGQIMEGVIDLLYERDGLLYIADYKTDRIVLKDWHQVRERYRHQAEIYSKAVQHSSQREVAAFKLIFLRTGAAIELKPDSKQGELFLTNYEDPFF
ncbi:MAG TPA: UvrD-helicase domain-containing protein [Candidatus Udaeobacter sp.]|nr:UvrD-helicase domain-containing protein [Candidatus Udaeobacter sp.]